MCLPSFRGRAVGPLFALCGFRCQGVCLIGLTEPPTDKVNGPKSLLAGPVLGVLTVAPTMLGGGGGGVTCTQGMQHSVNRRKQ